MNNVKRENVRESRILNSWEFSNLANVKYCVIWNILFCRIKKSQSSDKLPSNEF